MDKYPAGSIEHNGVTVPIFVDDTGRWGADYAGQRLRYDTRDKLETRIKALTRSATVRVEVPAVRVTRTLSGATRVRATLTGIHGGTCNPLVTLHFGDHRGDVKEQVISSWGSGETIWFGGDVTDEQITEYSDARAEMLAAQARVQKLEEWYKIQIKDAVQRAIDAQRGSDGQD